jgi:hypothetical protein
MKEEGLIANDERVKVWSSFKVDLIKMYRLVDTENKRPFLFYNKNKDISLFPSTSIGLKPIIQGYEKFYVKSQNDKIDRIKKLMSQFLSGKI